MICSNEFLTLIFFKIAFATKLLPIVLSWANLNAGLKETIFKPTCRVSRGKTSSRVR